MQGGMSSDLGARELEGTQNVYDECKQASEDCKGKAKSKAITNTYQRRV